MTILMLIDMTVLCVYLTHGIYMMRRTDPTLAKSERWHTKPKTYACYYAPSFVGTYKEHFF